MIGVIDSLSPSPPVETLNIGGDRNSFVPFFWRQTSELTCGICRIKTLENVGDVGTAKLLFSRCPILFFTFIRFAYLLIDSAFEPTSQFFKKSGFLECFLTASTNFVWKQTVESTFIVFVYGKKAVGGGRTCVEKRLTEVFSSLALSNWAFYYFLNAFHSSSKLVPTKVLCLSSSEDPLPPKTVRMFTVHRLDKKSWRISSYMHHLWEEGERKRANNSSSYLLFPCRVGARL